MTCRYTPDPEGYTVVPVIPVDSLVHNEHYCFCDDMTHECHENKESIALLNDAVQAGETTPQDADRIYRGKTV